jgi:hypothetical protein
VNGHMPIADGLRSRAKVWRGYTFVSHSSSSSTKSNDLNRKLLLLELCARIGYTPHEVSSPIATCPSRELLENRPCHNNTLS